MRFDVSLYTILWPPQTSFFACYMRPHPGPFLSFLAYYMGVPSDQFLRIEYGGPLRSVSSLIIEASLCLFFFFILYGGPSDHFFVYYIGASRSLASLTIWGPSNHFLLIQYGGPSHISFVVYYMPPTPLRSFFFACYRGPPQILVSSQNIWGPPQISLPAYYMGPPQVIFFVYYMGPPQISFCAYFLGAPLRSFFSLTIWGPLRSVSLHTIWEAPQINFFAYYMGVH